MVFFVSAFGNISVYALGIFITLSVLIFFQQLNLSRYKAVSSPDCPQNVVDLLGFQFQRRFVIYQRFQ